MIQGKTVLCLISSAMFDESAFPDADTFDISRSFGRSFHFGYGHHSCLGGAVGMVMVAEMVRQLCRKPVLTVLQDFEYLGMLFPERMMVSQSVAVPARRLVQPMLV